MKKHPEIHPGKTCSIYLSTLFLILSTGCHQDQVQVYQTEPDKGATESTSTASTNLSNPALPPGHPNISSMMGALGQMPGGLVPSGAQNVPPLTWTTPSNWVTMTPGAMRVGSFKISGPGGKSADVSIIPLPGMAGGDFANVNRWRGQVQLPAAPTNALQDAAQSVSAGGQPAQLYDVGGASSRILGAIQHRDNTTWFYKMTGDPDLVEQQKPAFIAFLQSISFSTQDQTPLPSGHPDIAGMASGSEPTSFISGGQPAWKVPADWKEESGGEFLAAKFLISGQGDSSATVNVSNPMGNGAGLLPNVNRWRAQLGLAPEKDANGMPLALTNGSAVIVDLAGTSIESGQPTRLIGIQATQAGECRYFKLLGDAGVVAAHKDEFIQFVQGTFH